jgi:hypothetical protein
MKRRVEKRIILVGIISFYLLQYLISILVLANYESLYSPENGQWYSWESFNAVESIIFTFYKYILPLPLGFALWFSNDLLFLNTFLIIPNIICVYFYWIRRMKKKSNIFGIRI